MGLFSRAVACGSLAVTPEQHFALPGERLTGAVLLHLDRALQDAELQIALVGNERLRAVHVHESDRSPTNATYELFNAQFELARGPFAAGAQVVPFSIAVPLGLPPSKNVEYVAEVEDERSELRVRIAYALHATLTVRDKNVQSLDEETAYTIAAHPTAVPVGEPREASASRTFRYAFWTEKGSCALRVAVPSDVVRVGERASAHVWLALSPPERLRHVRLVLRRRIVAHTKNALHHERVVLDLCATRIPQSRLGDATEFVLHLTIDPASTPPLREGARELQPLYPSETFRDFSVAYELVVECDVRGCNLVEACVPVTFVAPPAGVAA